MPGKAREETLRDNNGHGSSNDDSDGGNGNDGSSSDNSTNSALPLWRLEQLRAAGRARGEQLKRDKAHQSKAGKALSDQRGQTYMQEIGSAGHTKTLAANPDLQTNAGKSGKGKPKVRQKRTRGKDQPATAAPSSPQSLPSLNPAQVQAPVTDKPSRRGKSRREPL